MTTDPDRKYALLERLRDENADGRLFLPSKVLIDALLDCAGLCSACGGTGILTPPDPAAIGIREWHQAVEEWRKGCECVTRLFEAIECEFGLPEIEEPAQP